MDLYKLFNYCSLHQTRSSVKTGDGLAILIRKSITYSIRRNLNTNNDDTEVFCNEIIDNKGKPLTLALNTDSLLEGIMYLRRT